MFQVTNELFGYMPGSATITFANNSIHDNTGNAHLKLFTNESQDGGCDQSLTKLKRRLLFISL